MSDANFVGVEHRQTDHAARLDLLQHDIGQVRESIGELRGEMKGLTGALGRIEGKLETMQHANITAHAAQDDRMATLAERIGYHDGERSGTKHMGEWVRALAAGGVGSLIAWIATMWRH